MTGVLTTGARAAVVPDTHLAGCYITAGGRAGRVAGCGGTRRCLGRAWVAASLGVGCPSRLPMYTGLAGFVLAPSMGRPIGCGSAGRAVPGVTGPASPGQGVPVGQSPDASPSGRQNHVSGASSMPGFAVAPPHPATCHS
jgi:hypothetical protein